MSTIVKVIAFVIVSNLLSLATFYICFWMLFASRDVFKIISKKTGWFTRKGDPAVVCEETLPTVKEIIFVNLAAAHCFVCLIFSGFKNTLCSPVRFLSHKLRAAKN